MKAMILAAGVGSRLRPMTDHKPKPLVEVHGKALIVYHIEKLVACGITDLVVNTSYLAEMLWDYLQDGSQYGATIRYSHEPGSPLETAGGVMKALPMLGHEPFVLVNGDVWTDYPFSELKRGLKSEYLAHLVMVKNPNHHPKGDFYLSGIRDLKELYKVSMEVIGGAKDDVYCTSGIKYTFAGISIIDPQLFKSFTRGKLAMKPVFEAAMARHQVSAEIYDGVWCDVGTLERLEKLNKGI